MIKSSKKSDSLLFIIGLLILGVIIFLYLKFKEQIDKDIEEEIIDEEKKVELENKKNILNKHIVRNEAIKRLLDRKSKKYFKWAVRILILIYLSLNLIIYLYIPNITPKTLIYLSGSLVFAIGIAEFFFVQKVRKIKDLLIEGLKPRIEKWVFKKRPKHTIDRKIRIDLEEKEGVEKSLIEITQRKANRDERKNIDLGKLK
jgi:hypothetical protein